MILKDARRSRWSLCNFSAASLQKDFDTGGMTTEVSLLIKICLAWLPAKSPQTENLLVSESTTAKFMSMT
jgi:hypothetical protein